MIEERPKLAVARFLGQLFDAMLTERGASFVVLVLADSLFRYGMRLHDQRLGAVVGAMASSVRTIGDEIRRAEETPNVR